MEIAYRSLNGQFFLFKAKNIGDITKHICKYIDSGILTPEDLESFVKETYVNGTEEDRASLSQVFKKE